MVERDVVLAKAATIARCLARIAEVRGRADGALLPIDVEDIVVLNVTRAVQAAVDLAAHVVAAEGYGLPDSLAATFTRNVDDFAVTRAPIVNPWTERRRARRRRPPRRQTLIVSIAS